MLLVDSDENVSVGDREFGDDNGDGSDAYEPEGMVPTRWDFKILMYHL